MDKIHELLVLFTPFYKKDPLTLRRFRAFYVCYNVMRFVIDVLLNELLLVEEN